LNDILSELNQKENKNSIIYLKALLDQVENISPELRRFFNSVFDKLTLSSSELQKYFMEYIFTYALRQEQDVQAKDGFVTLQKIMRSKMYGDAHEGASFADVLLETVLDKNTDVKDSQYFIRLLSIFHNNENVREEILSCINDIGTRLSQISTDEFIKIGASKSERDTMRTPSEVIIDLMAYIRKNIDSMEVSTYNTIQ